MSLNSLIRSLSFSPPEEEMTELKRKVSVFLPILKREIEKKSGKASVFLGGSFAKETLVEKKVYDIDIFVRIPKSEFKQEIIEKAAKAAAGKAGYSVTPIHGSRDYYRMHVSDNAAFEIVPSLKISNPKQAENVIDLSYFHVDYIRKKIARNRKLAREIQLTKRFCMSSGVYGAESYIRGFSGYAIECLIVHYKSFLNFIKAVKKSKGKIIIDPERHYKKRAEILYLMNESKTAGPLVLVDPTWKERNVTAAVSQEAFDNLKEYAISFLKRPSRSFFDEHEFNLDKFKSKAKGNREYLCISLETDRQDGDIAGTKLKKYATYLLVQLGKQLEISASHFEYDNKKAASLHIISSPKKEIVFNGPPVNMTKHAAMFKAEHRNVFVKTGKIYAREKISKSAREIARDYISKNLQKAKEMALNSVRLD